MNSSPNAGSDWLSKFAWALLGVSVAGVYELGVKLKSNDKLTWRGLLSDLCLQVVNAVVAVKIATLANWGVTDTAYLALGIGVIGQKTALHIFRSMVMKWFGIEPEKPESTKIFTAPDTHVEVPAAAPHVDVIAVGEDTPKTPAEIMMMVMTDSGFAPDDPRIVELMRKLGRIK